MVHGDGADEASLARSENRPIPMDPTTAAALLREAKQILGQFNVTFFLRQGTCLGAIREKGFIPWDDDLDLGSVIGLHGFTEDLIEPVVCAFRDRGFYAELQPTQEYVNAAMIKSYIRIDWACYRIVGGSIVHFPGVPIPVNLVTRLKEIDFAGDKFLVPNPPEDYLSAKYGPDWMTPRSSGYEKDILDLIPDHPIEQIRSTTGESSASNTTSVRVLDQHGRPVHGALVRIAGHGRNSTDEQGCATFLLPGDQYYSLVISHDLHEELLYQELLARGMTYVYRPDPSTISGRLMTLSLE